MLSQTSAEAMHSATYVQHYLDCVENFPDQLQRYLTRIRELDVTYRACLREAESSAAACMSAEAGPRRARARARVQRSLIAAQEIGDEKLQLVQVVQDLIDSKSRELDHDYRNFRSCVEVKTNGASVEEAPPPAAEPPPVRDKEPPPAAPVAPPPRAVSPPPPPPHDRDKDKIERDKTGERWSKRPRRSRTATSNNAGAHTDGDSGERENTERTSGQHNSATHKKGIGKKKKRKARGSAAAAAARAETPPEEADAIDPDEPRYCLCDQISFGEMILCDNDLCPIEWFHFSCVYLTTKPKGKWFCPKCRGDRPNVMKPKGQFLKELERYNKEKEEKA